MQYAMMLNMNEKLLHFMTQQVVYTGFFRFLKAPSIKTIATCNKGDFPSVVSRMM